MPWSVLLAPFGRRKLPKLPGSTDIASIFSPGKPLDGSNRGCAHAKNLRIRILNLNTNRKPLSDPYPIKIAFNKWHSLNFQVVVLRLYCGRDYFNGSFETAIRIREKIDFSSHTGLDALQFAFAKVRQHVPFAGVEK